MWGLKIMHFKILHRWDFKYIGKSEKTLLSRFMRIYITTILGMLNLEKGGINFYLVSPNK